MEILQVELTQFLVTYKTKLTFGERQKIKAMMYGAPKFKGLSGADQKGAQIDQFNGDQIVAANNATILFSITEIKNKETGELVPKTEAWLDNLDEDDGTLLLDTIDEAHKKNAAEKKAQSNSVGK